MQKIDLLNKYTCTALKGLMALAIVICHLRNNITFLNNTYLGSILTASGYLLVGVFFFLSGYGLSESFKNKKDYCKGFLKNRLLPFYFDCIIFSIVYVAFMICKGSKISGGGTYQPSLGEAHI